MKARIISLSFAAALAAYGAAMAQGKTMDQRLIAAATEGDTARISELLAQGADVNTRDAQGRTPAMSATYAKRAQTVKALIEAGADVNIRDGMLNNPFLYAGAEGLLDILKLTVEAGADPKLTNRYGGTALIPAAERGHVDVVKYLLTHTRIDVNHVNNLGWTALLEAIILSDGGPRHQEIVALLIQHGADVNLPDRSGRTPLRHARERGYAKIQSMLEAKGARS